MRIFVAVSLLGSLALVQGSLLKVICDDITTIYVDGEEKSVAGTGVWNQMASVEVPDTASAIGIKCQNTGGPFGLMAQLDDDDGNTYMVTDYNWQCSNTPADGWAEAGFKGWAPAADASLTPYHGSNPAWNGMSKRKKVIWTVGNGATVYCRTDLIKPSDLIVDMFCDDITTIFVDGEQVEVSGTNRWNTRATYTIPGDTKVLGVKCQNTGGPFGITGQVTNTAGEPVVWTDDEWHCSSVAEDGWSTEFFEETDNWSAAAYTSVQYEYNEAKSAWANLTPNRRVIWAAGSSNTVYCRKVMNAHHIGISARWKRINGGLTQVSKGRSGVWGVNKHEDIWNLKADGKSWRKIGGKLVQVSSGASVWGVNRNDYIYKWLGTRWQNIGGRLTNVAVSDKDRVWGVNRGGNIYRWLGSKWENIAGINVGKQISVGLSGVWMVTKLDDIYYREGTYGDLDVAGTSWTHVAGKLKWLASGRDILVGVNANDNIFYRTGITAETPMGTGWVHVPGKLMTIDVEEDEVVGTNSVHNIWRCGTVEPPPPTSFPECEEGESCVREKGTGALLKTGVKLVSKNKRVQLELQGDGNLVLKCTVQGKVLWASGTNGKNIAGGLKFQIDGNVVMYEGSNAVWATDTNGNPDTEEFVVQDDNNLVLYNYESRKVLWSVDTSFSGDPNNMKNYCPDAQFVDNSEGDHVVRAPQVGSILSIGKKLVSRNGKAVLRMQEDGNLVLTCHTNEAVMWQTETRGAADGLKFQSDGNLVLYSSSREVLWSSGSDGNFEEAELVVQDDMNVVLYRVKDRNVLWSSGSNKFECPDAGSVVGAWLKNEGKYLSGYSEGVYQYTYLLKAEKECLKRSDCGGITFEQSTKFYTLRRGVELKDSPSDEISWLSVPTDSEGGHVFIARVNTNYKLHKGLEVGDVIKAFGIYKDSTTSKFNLNIMGKNNLNLLHVDIRPWLNVMVLNSNPPGVGWQAEVRPAFPNSKLEGGKIFSIAVEVLEKEYLIRYNGEEIGKFPQRQSIDLAEHIILRGGSNGFRWVAADVPPARRGPGLARPLETNEKANFMKPLTENDVISVWGVFADKSSAFSVNLMKDDNNRILHISFRPPPGENKIVLNSMMNGAWQTELRTPLPFFQDGVPFLVQIVCLADKFVIFVNGNDIGTTFPYREGFSLAEVKVLVNVGGSNGMVFTDMAPPVDKEAGFSLITKNLAVEVSSVGWGGEPGRAIDGNTNGIWQAGGCTCTAGNKDNWWKVRLAHRAAVKYITVYNRVDNYQSRINGVRVYAGDVYCGTIAYDASKNANGKNGYQIDCGGAVADFVKVEQDNDYLTLCQVDVSGVLSDKPVLRNVAIGAPTWESSVGWGGVPSRGTDGRHNGQWSAATCTHSANTGFNMWKVDLLDNYLVDSVVVFNRKDCCAGRIDGVKVFVDNEECGSITFVATQTVFKVDCGGKQGSVVKITQDGNYLTLCEVEVIGVPSAEPTNLINIAEGGEPMLSSTGSDWVAELAIDGNTNGDIGAGSCASAGAVNGYWKLTFDEPVAIRKVFLYNRMDDESDRINGVTVYADEMLCGKVRYNEGQRAYKVPCVNDEVQNTVVTSITIKSAPDEILTLCEVRVMSDPSVEVDSEQHLVNLAYHHPTKQSSTGWGGVSDRAVDGKESGKYSSGTCTHTNNKGWWQVDLQDKYLVKKVWIKNRVDCCSDRINNVKVMVGEAECGTIFYTPLKYGYMVECGENGLVGDYVRIINENTHLTLCEVRVWGPAEPIPDDDDDVVVTGDKSAAVDDATSVAQCPAGRAVRYCEVSTGQVANGADGAFVRGETSRDCVAYNGWSGKGVVAKAICHTLQTMPNPCNGPGLPSVMTVSSKGASPAVRCPKGYTPSVCNAHSPWFSLLRGKGIDEKGVIPNEKPCAIANCNEKNWCRVSLECEVKASEEYAAEVCATCDGYNCEEGYKCEMVDDDGDDEDKAYPTCVEAVDPCEENKCGDFGDCEPDGLDYICVCQEGYEFDEVTGSCLPVHSRHRRSLGDIGTGDNPHSYATCEKGERLTMCHTYGMPSAAKGVRIAKGESSYSCVAFSASVRAVAYCGDDTPVVDPCTQEEIHTINYVSVTDRSPTVSCPDGYTMESCIFYSPEIQYLAAAHRAKLNSIGGVSYADNVCSMESCLSGAPSKEHHDVCTLTAICKKIPGDEFKKAACPTCEMVRCPEGQECSMKDGGLPSCLEKVVGPCDGDVCGASGECKADGENYSCQCDEGYKFDGVTCIDVDECAEEPCGNGECTNTAGSFTCECDKGYKFSDETRTCKDVDECAEDTHKCSADSQRCANTEGSYECDCLDTFIPKKKKCVCAKGFESKDGACVDIDECALNMCGENQDCTNSEGSFDCQCKEGFKRDENNDCREFSVLECDVRAAKKVIKAAKGTNVKVKLKGETKKFFKSAKITWTKNDEAWNPKSDGDVKGKFNGFTIRKFDALDAGLYVGSIFMESDSESYKCDVECEIILLEGSVKLSIGNLKQLSKRQKAGNPITIKCDADIQNVKLKDAKSPDNITWYRVNGEEDEKLEANDNIEITKEKGNYKLTLKSPTKADAGVYRCAFEQADVYEFTDVTIDIKG